FLLPGPRGIFGFLLLGFLLLGFLLILNDYGFQQPLFLLLHLVEGRHLAAFRAADRRRGLCFIDLQHHLARGAADADHARSSAIARAEKIVLFSTRTLSTMPMMVASTGSFSVSGVRRALEPCTISTVSPSPAPTVSTQTNVRPVPIS